MIIQYYSLGFFSSFPRTVISTRVNCGIRTAKECRKSNLTGNTETGERLKNCLWRITSTLAIAGKSQILLILLREREHLLVAIMKTVPVPLSIALVFAF